MGGHEEAPVDGRAEDARSDGGEGAVIGCRDGGEGAMIDCGGGCEREVRSDGGASRERSRTKVADESEFSGDGSRVIVDAGGMEIAVFRAEGEYYAVGNYCVHQGGPLCEGGLNGRIVSDADGWEWRYEEEAYFIHCPWHGWIFDIRDGANVNSARHRAPTYDVEVEDGEVFVVR